MSRRVVVITGASYGLGRAASEAFAADGADVGLLARSRDGLEDARRAVEQHGRRALAVEVDVADADGVEDAAERIEREIGPIDVWVNNAMATIFGRVEDITPLEYRRATEVTYLGYVWGTLAALRRMKPRDEGVIVQVGSALAYRSIPLQSAYCGAKHAILGFTDSLRSELLHDRSNVRLTMVHLPALNTPQFEVGRNKMGRRAQPVPPIYEPEVAAEAIVWASRNPRREVWVAPSTVAAIVGDKLAPASGDRYLARAGFEAQQGDELADTVSDNLFEPVAGVRGARGRFSDRARQRSVQLWLTMHRDALVTAAGAAVALAALRRR